jgi:hypothetical protein
MTFRGVGVKVKGHGCTTLMKWTNIFKTVGITLQYFRNWSCQHTSWSYQHTRWPFEIIGSKVTLSWSYHMRTSSYWGVMFASYTLEFCWNWSWHIRVLLELILATHLMTFRDHRIKGHRLSWSYHTRTLSYWGVMFVTRVLHHILVSTRAYSGPNAGGIS